MTLCGRGRKTRQLPQAVVGVVIAACVACGGHGGPTVVPPPPGAPTVACPANITAPAHNGVIPEVTFDAPAAQGGQAPVSVACSPASGTQFQIGDTPVVCTASDSGGQTGNCTFSVTVSVVPQISLTKFMAFGDSLTSGTTSPAPGILTLNEPDSYPSKLLAMMSARYLDQTITMANEGYPGKKAVDDFSRFQDAMRADTPQVVLLMHGANDLNGGGGDAIPGILGSLEKMIDDARSRGAKVYLATLPPQDPNGKNGRNAGLLPKLNLGIIATAADEGATIVDLFGQLGGNPAGIVGADGLHPTPEGYQKIAEIWRDSIESSLELPPAAPPLSVPGPRDDPARRCRSRGRRCRRCRRSS